MVEHQSPPCISALVDTVQKTTLPPSLGHLLEMLGDVELIPEFRALVQEFLPEYAGAIFSAGDPQAQVAAFASRFEDRYFPLDPVFEDDPFGEIGFAQLLGQIPIIALGISEDDYHDLSLSSDYLLLWAFIESPHGYPTEDDGGRTALLEECANYLPRDLLQRLPASGFAPDDLHKLLDGTKFEALAMMGFWLWAGTENIFLDVDEEYLAQVTGEPEWSMPTVEALTRQWQQAQHTIQAIDELAKWLKAAPEARFSEVLDFIEERRRDDDSIPMGTA